MVFDFKKQTYNFDSYCISVSKMSNEDHLPQSTRPYLPLM